MFNNFNEMLQEFNETYKMLKGMIERDQFQNLDNVTLECKDYTYIAVLSNGEEVGNIRPNHFNVFLDSLSSNEIEAISDIMKIMDKVDNINQLGKMARNN